MVSQDIDHALLIKIICFLKRQTILDLIYIYKISKNWSIAFIVVALFLSHINLAFWSIQSTTVHWIHYDPIWLITVYFSPIWSPSLHTKY